MKTMSNFVHLHNHTEYSFLDGAVRIDDMVKRAAEFRMPALAITDHGGMFGVIEFYEKCMAAGIKPVIGFEAYVAPGSRLDRSTTRDERSNYHLLLLAKNRDGYKNLMKLSTIGYTEGFYYKPRIDMESLRAHSAGIICSTACIAGAVPRALIDGRREEAKKIAQEYLSIFGEGNFYFELQNHGIDEELIVFDDMVKLGNELGVPFIVTNDAHYLNAEDAASHEILLCIQTQTTMADPDRYRFSTDQVYFKSPQEMAKLFPDQPEALANTLRIAEQCNVSVKEKTVLPVPDLPEGFDSEETYLRSLAREGLAARYAGAPAMYAERLEFELSVICQMKFAGYFLIVRDFVLTAKNMGIMVGCRGSAAGSLVAHCIGITDVDPIRFDLIFERFLNPERISLPDADIDFADEDRYKVIEYVVKKYGRDSVCQIINFGRMMAKMVVKDVARAMGVPIADAVRLSGMVTEKTLANSIKANGELSRTIEGSAQFKELFRHARALEGLVRQAGMHAGGVIIAPGPVVNWAPLFKQPNSASITTQFDMDWVEKAGLIKMDFLGLRTLTVLQETLRLIKKDHGVDIDLWKLPEGDAATYDLFGRGETTGVFQFESQGMQDYLRKLKPNRIEDLIAMAALYRPGPMQNIDSFIHRKHGKEKVEYPHPMLSGILDITYGVIVYQEQVMRIARDMAGFSMGQADTLRKAMGKKQADVMEKMRTQFIDGAVKKGINTKSAEEVYQLMARFAEYGFNKAHATVYAHVAYQAAYLKAHHPLEYMTANLTSWLGDQDEFLIMKNEAQRLGIKVLPPDINSSDIECRVEAGDIRLGLKAVKNVGKAAESILESRRSKGKFESIFDLCRSVDVHQVNKKALESMVYAGALDSLKGLRSQLFAAIDAAIEYGSGFQKDRLTGQTSLFDGLFADGQTPTAEVNIPEPELPDIPPWPYNELLAKEKEIMNFYVSGHPLDHFQDEVRGFVSTSMHADALKKLKDGDNVTVGGLITTLRSHMQRDGRPMAFIKLEDFDGSMELIAFGDAFAKYGHLLAPDSMVLAHGQVMMREGETSPKVRIENAMSLVDSREKLAKSVHVRVRTQALEKDFIQELQAECAKMAGECALILHLVTQESNEYRVRARNFRINPGIATIKSLRDRLGKENVWLGKTMA
jgi:DNA polymerase-3 subunit alpha